MIEHGQQDHSGAVEHEKKAPELCQEHGKERAKTTRRVHRQTLVAMNRSFFTARRNKSHEIALAVLREELFSSSKEQRAELYRFCLNLLDDALTATNRSQLRTDTPVRHYLKLLHETLSAALALVNHEMTLIQEESAFARLLGRERVAQFQTATDVFSTSEMNILNSIDDLLRFGENIMEEDTARRMRTFSSDDRNRYDIALAEYDSYYRRRLAQLQPAT